VACARQSLGCLQQKCSLEIRTRGQRCFLPDLITHCGWGHCAGLCAGLLKRQVGKETAAKTPEAGLLSFSHVALCTPYA
jgi:hypothetical protein